MQNEALIILSVRFVKFELLVLVLFTTASRIYKCLETVACPVHAGRGMMN